MLEFTHWAFVESGYNRHGDWSLEAGLDNNRTIQAAELKKEADNLSIAWKTRIWMMPGTEEHRKTTNFQANEGYCSAFGAGLSRG